MFTERLNKRNRLWWEPMRPWWTPDGLLLNLHRRGLANFRRRDADILRSRSDPDRKWHCCRYWQRTLINKWNSREFAQKHGCRVPELYWFGKNLKEMPLESLPDYYVIRPICGTGGKGVYVMSGDFDLMSNTYIGKAQLREHLISKFGEVAKQLILVEEFVRSERGEYKLPTEYQFYTFGDKIPFIKVSEKISRKEMVFRQRFTLDWDIFPEPTDTFSPLSESGYTEPPQCLEAMLSCVRKLGVAFGTFVRVDYCATDKGPVFSEFSSAPQELSAKYITKFGDEYLGRMWNEVYPDRV